MKSKIETKVCGVCGDKALGHNFNALSCESCKAFFRRNALTQKSFKCPFNNQCEITTITRRFCQKCRLDKCIAIGMCKDLIMSEEDKVAKRQKIEENRVKRECTSGFKKGFKKMKKESVDLNVQDNSDSEDTVYSEKCNQPNKNDQMSTMDITIYKRDTEGISPTETLVSSSDEISITSNKLSSSESDCTLTITDFLMNGSQDNNSKLSNPNYITSKNNIDSCTKDVMSVLHRQVFLFIIS